MMEQLVLDTGPFLEFVAWKIELERHAVGIPFRRGLQFHGLDSEPRARGFDRLLQRHKGRLITTLGVLVEVHNQACRCLERTAKAEHVNCLRRLWAFILSQIETLEISEPAAPARSIPHRDLGQLGVVDTTLASVAKGMSTRQRPTIVVTNDGGLFTHCHQQGVGVKFARDMADEESG